MSSTTGGSRKLSEKLAAQHTEWSKYLDSYQSLGTPGPHHRRHSKSFQGISGIISAEEEDPDEDPFEYIWNLVQGPFVLFCIGISCAIIGYTVIVITNIGNDFRQSLAIRGTVVDFTTIASYLDILHYVAFCMAFALLSLVITQWICPSAAGSGLPEMKAILSGTIKPVLLSPQLILAKLGGLLAAFTAGLSIGKEGPFVHVAAAVADNIMRLPMFRSLHEQDSKRLDVLSHACAAGVASSFGASFGSVLFALEFTSTSYVLRMLPEAFVTAITSITVIKQFDTQVGETLFVNSDDDAKHAVSIMGSSLVEVFIFIGIGVTGGLLGVGFVALVDNITSLRNRLLSVKMYGADVVLSRKFMFVILVVLIVAPLQYFELVFGLHGDHPGKYLFETPWYPPPPPKENDDDNIAFVVPSLQLMTFLPYKFLVTALSVTLPLPVGLFTPVFMIGGIIGRLIGELIASISAFDNRVRVVSNYLPREYALIGAAAFSTGVTRAISTAVIIFELSNNPHLCLPISLAIVSSYFVSQRLYKNVYEALMDTNSIPFMQELPSSERYVSVTKVMETLHPKDVLSLGDTYRYVEEVLVEAGKVQSMIERCASNDNEIARSDGKVGDRYAYNMSKADFIPVVKDRHSMQLIGVVQKIHLLEALSHFPSLNSPDGTPWSSLQRLNSGVMVYNLGRPDAYSPLSLDNTQDRVTSVDNSDQNEKNNTIPLREVSSNNAIKVKMSDAEGKDASIRFIFNGSYTILSPEHIDQSTVKYSQSMYSLPSGSDISEYPVVIDYDDEDLEKNIKGSRGTGHMSNADNDKNNATTTKNGPIASTYGNTHSHLTATTSDSSSVVFDIPAVYLDPSPFILLDTCILSKADLCFRRLKLNSAYVISGGRLVGLITYIRFVKYISSKAKRPLVRCFKLLRAIVTAVCKCLLVSRSNATSGMHISSSFASANSANYSPRMDLKESYSTSSGDDNSMLRNGSTSSSSSIPIRSANLNFGSLPNHASDNHEKEEKSALLKAGSAHGQRDGVNRSDRYGSTNE